MGGVASAAEAAFGEAGQMSGEAAMDGGIRGCLRKMGDEFGDGAGAFIEIHGVVLQAAHERLALRVTAAVVKEVGAAVFAVGEGNEMVGRSVVVHHFQDFFIGGPPLLQRADVDGG